MLFSCLKRGDALEGLEGLNMDKGADQKLDFTYVEDAARRIALLFNAENLRHKVFNIATGKAHSVGEVVELVRKHTQFTRPRTCRPRRTHAS